MSQMLILDAIHDAPINMVHKSLIESAKEFFDNGHKPISNVVTSDELLQFSEAYSCNSGIEKADFLVTSRFYPLENKFKSLAQSFVNNLGEVCDELKNLIDELTLQRKSAKPYLGEINGEKPKSRIIIYCAIYVIIFFSVFSSGLNNISDNQSGGFSLISLILATLLPSSIGIGFELFGASHFSETTNSKIRTIMAAVLLLSVFVLMFLNASMLLTLPEGVEVFSAAEGDGSRFPIFKMFFLGITEFIVTSLFVHYLRMLWRQRYRNNPQYIALTNEIKKLHQLKSSVIALKKGIASLADPIVTSKVLDSERAIQTTQLRCLYLAGERNLVLEKIKLLDSINELRG